MPSSLTRISIETDIESNFQFGKTNKTPKTVPKTLDFFGPNKIFSAVSLTFYETFGLFYNFLLM